MIQYDCVIVGGGLAGSLMFYALKEKYPSKNIILIEKNNKLGGKHTWCFHDHDIDHKLDKWLNDLLFKSFNGYEVKFPKYQRQFTSKYYAIKSSRLNQILMDKYSESIRIGCEAKILNNELVELDNGEIIYSKIVIGAKGWICEQEAVGYQKFVGLNLKLKRPHTFTNPILKDVTITQIDGYRFIYILPWSNTELLIEDTYYSNESSLDVDNIKNRILNYAEEIGLDIESIDYEESGSLPLVDKFSEDLTKSLSIGVRSGAFHPVTGYSFPYTYRRIKKILESNTFDEVEWKKILNNIDKQEASNSKYFHFLNKMVFKASSNNERFIIFQRFYTFNESLIENFYSGTLTAIQKARILIGKPPVSINKALKSIMN